MELWNRFFRRHSSRRATVERVVARLGPRWKDTPVPGLDASAYAVFWYGTPELGPTKTVIWLLLRGPESERVPPWHTVGSAAPDAPVPLPAETLAWLAARDAELGVELAAEGWPGVAPPLSVESEERVQLGGGFAYFK